jgi:hypothetical protein
MAIGDEDVDKSERPVNPPMIRRVEIVLNPIEDIFPRDLPYKKLGKIEDTKVQSKAKKAVEYK